MKEKGKWGALLAVLLCLLLGAALGEAARDLTAECRMTPEIGRAHV